MGTSYQDMCHIVRLLTFDLSQECPVKVAHFSFYQDRVDEGVSIVQGALQTNSVPLMCRSLVRYISSD